jgi:hypothetical protein
MTERSEGVIRLSPPGRGGSSQPSHIVGPHGPNGRYQSEEPA